MGEVAYDGGTSVDAQMNRGYLHGKEGDSKLNMTIQKPDQSSQAKVTDMHVFCASTGASPGRGPAAWTNGVKSIEMGSEAMTAGRQNEEALWSA